MGKKSDVSLQTLAEFWVDQYPQIFYPSSNICPKCRKKLYEYEKKYNCVVDIGMNGCDGARGEKYILPHGERRRN